jgi:hypothetical protein
MAFTQQSQFSFTILDQLGVEATMRIYVLADPTKTIANLASDWQTWAGLIDLIVGGQILHGTARLMLLPTGDEKTSPAAGSRVEQTGNFTFPNASNSRLFGEAVPSISDSVIVSGRIDLTDTNVSSFYTAMSTATANTEPTNNQFLVLDALHSAFLSFRKRRRSLDRVSYEV